MAQQKANKISSLDELFIDVLEDIYDAEHQITEAMPKMIEAATSPDLKKGLKDHLEQTRKQVERLDQIFKNMNKKAEGKKCHGMQGLIKEGDEIMKEASDPMVKDAGMIAAAQKIEHYEISAYGTARTYAQALGHKDVARLLEQTLQEEGATDKRLTALAEGHINAQAKKG